MPKAILEFILPEDEWDFKAAQSGTKMRGLFFEIDQDLRNKLKHGHEFKSPDEALEYVRSIIHEGVGDLINE